MFRLPTTTGQQGFVVTQSHLYSLNKRNTGFVVPRVCRKTMGECTVYGCGVDVDAIVADLMTVSTDDVDDAMNEHKKVDGSTFDATRYFDTMRRLRGKDDDDVVPTVLITARSTGSTQTSLQKRAGRLVDGTVFVADRQRGGRGRGGNTWESPDGCLMFSMSCTYPGDGKTLPFVQYMVSLAIVDTIQSLVEEENKPFPIRIKWPNDIYYCPHEGGGAPIKIGGVLCHSSYRDSSFCMTIGVGINVSNSKPTTCLCDIFQDAEIRREDVVAGIVHQVETMLPKLADSGFDQFKQAYCHAWLHSGQCVTVTHDDQLVSVRISGLTEQGYLLATALDDNNACSYELCPDGNSLDFFRGLIVTKKSS